MMQLIKAIHTAYNDPTDPELSDLKTANTGGLWTEEAKQNLAMPYIVLHHITGGIDHTMGCGSDIVGGPKRAVVQFSIFGSTFSMVREIYDKLVAAYDNTGSLVYAAEFGIQAATPVSMIRINETGPTQFKKDIWMVTVDYEVYRTG